MEWRFEQYETDATWPLPTGNTLLIGVGPALCCIDQTTGRLQWESLFEAHIEARPCIGDETGFVIDDSGMTHAVDVSTGTVHWSREVNANGAVPPVTDGNSVITTTNGGLASLTPNTGEYNWECQLPSGPTGPPALAEETVYTGTEDGVVYAISRGDGSVQWEKSVANPLTRAGAIISDDILYIPTAPVHSEAPGKLYALDTMTREITWSVDTLPTTEPEAYQVAPPVVHDGTVYLVTGLIWGDSHLQAIQAGQSLWYADVPGTVVSSPTISSDMVLTASGRDLQAFERDTGAQIWATQIGESPGSHDITVPHGSPIITEQSVIVRGARQVCAVSLDSEAQTDHGDRSGAVATQSAIGSTDTVTDKSPTENALERTSTVRYPSTSSRITGDATCDWGFHSAGGHLINPMPVDDSVYLASLGGIATALDTEAGTIRWLVELDEKFEKCPLVADETLYLSGRDRTFALDPENGSIRSRDATVPDSPRQPTGQVATPADDSISVGCTPDGEQVLVTVTTDEDGNAWQFEDEIPTYPSWWDLYHGQIGTTLFVGIMFKYGPTAFYALDNKTESVSWRLVGHAGGGSDIFAPPIRHDGRIFVTSSNHFYAIDPGE